MNEEGVFLTTLQDELRSAFLSANQLQELQLRRLRTLLDRAVRFVPFYRDRFREHLSWLPGLAGPDDLWRLPAVNKEEYLSAGPRSYVDQRQELDHLIRQSTSGSLGHVLHLYATPMEAMIHSALLWTGWMERATASDRLFCMAAPYLDFQHQYLPNTFIPVQTSVAETRRRFIEFQPTLIVGSVEAIALLARDLRQNDVSARSRVRRVFPFGQTLTPYLEAMIREGFDCEIFNLYGARETVWIAGECEQQNGLHIPVDRVIVQIARVNRPDQAAAPGELGEVIVTSLARWTTPIIRYRLGDVAVIDSTPCQCGRSTPRIKALEGRIQDLLVSVAGDWVSPGAVSTDLAYDQQKMFDHRIVQEALDLVRVWIVAAPGFGDRECEHIVNVLRRHLGPVKIAIELVEQIPRDPSGKRRRVYRAFTPDSLAGSL